MDERQQTVGWCIQWAFVRRLVDTQVERDVDATDLFERSWVVDEPIDPEPVGEMDRAKAFDGVVHLHEHMATTGNPSDRQNQAPRPRASHRTGVLR